MGRAGEPIDLQTLKSPGQCTLLTGLNRPRRRDQACEATVQSSPSALSRNRSRHYQFHRLPELTRHGDGRKSPEVRETGFGLNPGDVLSQPSCRQGSLVRGRGASQNDEIVSHDARPGSESRGAGNPLRQSSNLPCFTQTRAFWYREPGGHFLTGNLKQSVKPDGLTVTDRVVAVMRPREVCPQNHQCVAGFGEPDSFALRFSRAG